MGCSRSLSFIGEVSFCYILWAFFLAGINGGFNIRGFQHCIVDRDMTWDIWLKDEMRINFRAFRRGFNSGVFGRG